VEKYLCPLCGKTIFSSEVIEKHKSTCEPLPDFLPDFKSIKQCLCSSVNPCIILSREKREFSKKFPEKRFKNERGIFDTERTALYINGKLYIVDESFNECRIFISQWLDTPYDVAWSCAEDDPVYNDNMLTITRKVWKNDFNGTDVNKFDVNDIEPECYTAYKITFYLDSALNKAVPAVSAVNNRIFDLKEFFRDHDYIIKNTGFIPKSLKMDFGYNFSSLPLHNKGYWVSFEVYCPSGWKQFSMDWYSYDLSNSNSGYRHDKKTLEAQDYVISENFVKALMDGFIPDFRKGLCPWVLYTDLNSDFYGCFGHHAVYTDENIHIELNFKELKGIFKEENYIDTSV
jgi:hypothetical protein